MGVSSTSVWKQKERSKGGVGSGELRLPEAGVMGCGSHSGRGWIEIGCEDVEKQVGAQTPIWYVSGEMANYGNLRGNRE